MKKFILAFSILLVSSAILMAQHYAVQTLVDGGTIAATTTNSYTSIAVLKKADTTASQISFKLDGAGTGNVVAKFACSVDGANYETTPSITITIAANGTSTVNTVSSLTTKGAQTLKLVSIENANSSGVTNLVVNIGTASRNP